MYSYFVAQHRNIVVYVPVAVSCSTYPVASIYTYLFFYINFYACYTVDRYIT